MATGLWGGSLGDFDGSMAKAIEDALNAVLAERQMPQLTATGADDRRTLFIAIARGVISYLYENEDAITLTIGANTYSPSIMVRSS